MIGRSPLGNRRSRRAGAKIRNTTIYRNTAGTLLGLLSAELPSGQIIYDLKLVNDPKGSLWIVLPAAEQLEKRAGPVSTLMTRRSGVQSSSSETVRAAIDFRRWSKPFETS